MDVHKYLCKQTDSLLKIQYMFGPVKFQDCNLCNLVFESCIAEIEIAKWRITNSAICDCLSLADII
jgi:hypothetical protein